MILFERQKQLTKGITFTSEMMNSPNILVAPLNWGLGHATRCMPIIEEIERQGGNVILGSDGRALKLLEKEYPNHQIVELPPYDIHYKNRFGFIVNILQQSPKIIRNIERERKAIKSIVEQYDIDAIIADNRFGCRSDETYNVFMSHQIHFYLPKFWRFADTLMRKINRGWIEKFDECWVPDVEGNPNLTGSMSHSVDLDKSFYKYIGPLSRLKKLDLPIKYKVLALLSGPEPQRTNLEKIMIEQLKDFGEPALIVRGKPESDRGWHKLNSYVDVVDFLDSSGINEAICQSEWVISRSGYTTVMDLFKLDKKAIFIPTPGQTEQVLLGDIYKEQGLFYSINQKQFDLRNALVLAEEYSGPRGISMNDNLMKQQVSLLMDKVAKANPVLNN